MGAMLTSPGSPRAAVMLDQPILPPSPDHRTIYLGNLKRSTTVEDLCNVIRGGALERIRLIPEKRIAFVSFISAASAADFHRRALHPGLVVKHQRLRPGWGRPRPLPAEVMRAVSVGASRNVYLGGLEDPRAFTVERLRADFAEYGEIELVNTLPERQCAFVNFTSVAAAVKAVDAIRGKPGYERVRVNFGKDRCANPPRPELDAGNHASGNGEVTSPGMSPVLLPSGNNDVWLGRNSLDEMPRITNDMSDLNNSVVSMTNSLLNDATTSDIGAALQPFSSSQPATSSWALESQLSPRLLARTDALDMPSLHQPLSVSLLADNSTNRTTFTGNSLNRTLSSDSNRLANETTSAADTNSITTSSADVSLFSWGTRGPRSLSLSAGSGHSHDIWQFSLDSMTSRIFGNDDTTSESPWQRRNSLEARLTGSHIW
jgi:hypothetical protein